MEDRGQRRVSRSVCRPAQSPAATDRTSPSSTAPHRCQRMQPRLPSRANAAPDSPAARAWLSLVGIPHHQAAAAHRTTAPIAAHRAREAALGPPPKAAME